MAKPIQKVITHEFVDNAQSWELITASSYIAGGWFRRAIGFQDNFRPNPPVSAIRGCLRATIRKNAPSNVESYWRLVKTWEELGVPVGSVISSVNLDFNYRWQCQANSKHKATDNLADFTGLSLGVGDVTIRNSLGTSLGTISTRKFSQDRTPSEGVQWKCDPNGVDGGDITSSNGWYTSTGTPVAISHPNATSNKQIELRIGLLHPAMSPGTGNHAWVRTKIDHIIITIQHSQGTTFFMF